ncbi:MAG: glutamine--fructose-6-phosphate transaminase (isomerizing) [Deltaproteobacteria bacterium]|nr:MAG: glutamine--fructose-6-phosphate transaminase (isomerizing) [Deltaproteobacteria bacterium]
MCGIIAYIGPEEALPRLLEGLKRLEYRGYDSAGVALVDESGIWTRREVGRVAGLVRKAVDPPHATVGIAHTRWATHGGVTLANTHPHMDGPERIAVVHNGIIENMDALKAQLEAEGVEFRSETDTEVLPHLIRRHYKGDPLQAVRSALAHVHGSYGIAVAFAEHPDLLIAARFGSPLVIGLGDGETVLASDPQAIVAHTRRVLYLDDREVALITAEGASVQRLDGGEVDRDVSLIEADYGVADLAGHPHFMSKEIWEQPESLRRCLRGRIQREHGNAKLGGLNMSPRDLVNVREVVTVGCGTAFHAGMVGSMAIEHLARIPARAEVASEFRNRHPIIGPDTLYFAVSQSGETADTLGAIEEIQVKGGQVMGVVNVVGSTIARTCGAGTYVYAGPEIAVASTKAFTSQVTAMLVFTLMLARTRNLSLAQGEGMAEALLTAPDKVSEYLADPGPIDAAVELVKDARYCLFMGRGFSYPVALEGALKLKEITYVPCEAYPAGEMKHGPIAMLEKGTPVIVVAPRGSQRDKVISNIKEVEARGAKCIIIHTQGDEELARLAAVSIPVPDVREFVSPLVTVLPLQLLAYKVGLALGRDIDKPRNLAKSVTVE